MKLKDFKNDPAKYKRIKQLCLELGIKDLNDETDINELIGTVNATKEGLMDALVKAGNSTRKPY